MDKTPSLLARIHDPADLKSVSPRDLDRLAAEIREAIVDAVSRNGGHLASNLGVVELTVALHRVFNSPHDKIIWDVGHQCYAHKLLTGRREVFGTLRRSSGISGFPKREESPHDAFDTGHASTSISAALGILAGNRLEGSDARAVAVIGDGALTGGLAYEGLSHAGQLGLPLVVVLNDNKMSISPNVGGLSKYLSRLSSRYVSRLFMKARYRKFRRVFDGAVKRLPFGGDALFRGIRRLKRAVKAVFYLDNFFVDLGFEYVGPIDGHHIPHLEEVFRDVRRFDMPVVVHVVTRKGRGYRFAEKDPGSYHGVPSFSITSGLGDGPPQPPPEVRGACGFTEAFGESLLRLGREDRRVAAITAAMEKGTGLSRFKAAFPERFFDAGIAEGHAVTFAAGLASRGMRPVAAIYSTFIQRAFDQAIHDVALQNLPVVFALDRAGFVSDDGPTHQGLFDIPLFRTMPNMTIFAPACAEELDAMLAWALRQNGPVMIRYPKAPCPSCDPHAAANLVSGRGVFLRRGSGARVCLAFTGSLYPAASEAACLLETQGIAADLYNLRFLKPVDEAYLADILTRYERVVCVEEGVTAGGFGEYAAEVCARRGCAARVAVLGATSLTHQGKRDDLLRKSGLDGPSLSAAASPQPPPSPTRLRRF
ncbi:MAG: 1-deoxy-D-xylulose-5-phosphate synthase [Spirochaetaceae bacterium]|jgi:1-deoxy-D-xylulose-5-phosphate synthase|nr:1-deoxy-D-xylulose-5-phosphate synthase [Spirochaetaceae bacterium]